MSFETETLDIPTLHLTDVFLKTFTQKLEGNQRELILRGNDLFLRKGYRLVDSDMSTICDWLRNHCEVTALDFSYNRLTNDGLYTLIEFLEETDHVTRLNLMCNDIGCEGMQRLYEVGDKLTLKSLRINGNKFGSEGGKCVALFLGCNTHLIHLDVGETDQTASGLAYFTTVLRTDRGSNDTLQMLDLSRPLPTHKMHRFGTEHVAETVGLMLQFNTSLKELHLQKFDFSDTDTEALMRGLRWNKSLLLLDLSCNYLGCQTMELLSEYLLSKPPLRALLLSHNNIRDHGATSLSRSLPYSRVMMLDLAYNQVTGSGLQDLLYTIKKPVKLTTLYLWGNSFSRLNARTIRRMLYSGVLEQDSLDVVVYRVNQDLKVARNTVDRYKHIYYCVGDYGFPPPIRLPKREVPDIIPTQRVYPRSRERSKIKDESPRPSDDHYVAELVKSITKLRHSSILKDASILSKDRMVMSLIQMISEGEVDISSKPIHGELSGSGIPKEMSDIQKHLSSILSSRVWESHSSCPEEPDILDLNAHMLSLEKISSMDDDFQSVSLPKIDSGTEKVSLLSASQQTSMEFEGIPRFWDYIPPYPIAMLDLKELEEEARRQIKSILEEVEKAYVRKYQLPCDFCEDDYDLSDDPNYMQNLTPIFPYILESIKAPVISKPMPEDVLLSPVPSEPEIPEEEEDMWAALSKYQILEKNIYGVTPAEPLPEDPEEALQLLLKSYLRDSLASFSIKVDHTDRITDFQKRVLSKINSQRFSSQFLPKLEDSFPSLFISRDFFNNLKKSTPASAGGKKNSRLKLGDMNASEVMKTFKLPPLI